MFAILRPEANKSPYQIKRMFYSAPAKKANDLIDQINLMIETSVDDLKLGKIRREANKLKDSGFFVESTQVLGMLAAFQGDADEVDRLFSAAKRASGNDSLIILNHSVSLLNLRSFRKAVEVAAKACERSPDDVTILFESLRINIESFNVESAMELVDLLKRLGKDVEKMDDTFIPKLAARIDVMQESKASWEEICDRISLASGVLSKRGFPPMMCPIREMVGDGAMLYEFSVPTDAAGAAEAEDAILNAIAGQPYSRADKAIVFYCVPA